MQNTGVRSSASKGLGRICMRLDQGLVEEVVPNILELFSPEEDEGAWHGACLALAELSRRGLLLPALLPDAVNAVLKVFLFSRCS